MPNQLSPAQFSEYLASLRILLQQHYRHLSDGQPHHHGPLVERASDGTYGFDALIVLLPPYAPKHASIVLDILEAAANDSFDSICEPGAPQVIEHTS
jgi:hypothetical protein